jgi:hypothetical protein
MKDSNTLTKLIFTGGLNQLVMAVIGLARVPLVIGTFGTESFASYSAAIGFWTLIAAVGESARQRIRIFEFSGFSSSLYSKILWQSLGIAAILSGLIGAIFLNFGNQVSPDLGTFSVALACGLIYIPFAMAIGKLEGQFKFASTNLTIASGQIIGFFITIVGCYSEQIWLVGVSVLIPFFLPGVLSWLLGIVRRNGYETSGTIRDYNGVQKDTRSLLLLVLISETLVYAVDGALVLKFAGPNEAAIFAIVQRIASVFAILPIIVAPLSSSLNIKDGTKALKKQVQRIQVLAGVGLFAVALSAGGFLFSFLSKGHLQLNYWTLLAASASGLVLAMTTTEIQSATSSNAIRLKARVTPALALTNLILTASLCPIIGATAAFLTTGTGQLVYFVLIRNQRRVRI